MQEVVELPRLVADPQVVVLGLGHIGEHVEVREQDLVHRAQRLERVQVVLTGLGLDVRRLARQQPRRRVHALAACGEHVGDRVLREPGDLQVRMQRPELVGDRQVAADVAEPDR